MSHEHAPRARFTTLHAHDSRAWFTMMRLACLYVSDFPLAALRRAHPDLLVAPVAVAAGPGPRARLLAISTQAAQRGVTVGLTAAQAQAAAADVIVREVSADTV